MALFVSLAIALSLFAVAFAVAALWRGSRGLALGLAVGIPLLAAGLYQFKGTPAALDPANLTPAAHDSAGMAGTMEAAVAQLEQRVAADPENFDQLALLARSYMAMEKFELAPPIFVRALKLHPDDEDLSVEYAEALLRTSPDRSFPPAAVKIIEDAVAKNPNNQRALFFLGLQRMQTGRPAEAAAAWESLLPMLDAETGQTLMPQIDAARAAAGLPPLPKLAPAPAAGLDIEVRVDPALAGKVAPGDVLYVFARSSQGGGPPVAVKRIELGNLPVQLQLTDADSPMPAAKLSGQQSVLLVARISKSGDVKAASGDIEAGAQEVRSDQKSRIILVLDHPVP
jgi:cytochrome c-type biogenesis protein CcmH